MLESVDFSAKKLSKKAYKPEWDQLMERLVVLQQQAHSAGIGLVVLFEGWNGAGKGSRISDSSCTTWMPVPPAFTSLPTWR